MCRAPRQRKLAGVAIDLGERDPSGTSNAAFARPAVAFFMNWVQIGSAAWLPLSDTGWLSSKPTQTTVSRSGVKPTNHASRRSLVVPLLPAASNVNPAARACAGALVEHAAHHVGDEIRRIRRARPCAARRPSA